VALPDGVFLYFELFDCRRDASVRHDLATVHVAVCANRLTNSHASLIGQRFRYFQRCNDRFQNGVNFKVDVPYRQRVKAGAGANGPHLGETAIYKQFRSRDLAAFVGCEKHRDWHSLWTEKHEGSNEWCRGAPHSRRRGEAKRSRPWSNVCDA
jgi:hypothetical protein